MDEERTFRIAVIVIGHVMWLSTGALRILGGRRAHRVRADAPWLIRFYPPLVWVPLVIATLFWKVEVPLAGETRLLGLAIALAGALFGAWGMWALGRQYGFGLDVFREHRLRTDGPFALVRHSMYLGVIAYHVGASVALAHTGLLGVTALLIVPYTAVRIAYEERALEAGFGGEYAAYARHVPQVLPLPR